MKKKKKKGKNYEFFIEYFLLNIILIINRGKNI